MNKEKLHERSVAIHRFNNQYERYTQFCHNGNDGFERVACALANLASSSGPGSYQRIT